MKTPLLPSFLFALLLLVGSSLFAQWRSPAGEPNFDYKPGYVVLKGGEIVYGEIKMNKRKFQSRGDHSGWGRQVILRARRQGRTRYDAEELQRVVISRGGYPGDVIYESHPHPRKENRTVFYEVLLEGPVTVYANPRDYPMGEKVRPNRLSYFVQTEAHPALRLIKKRNYREFLRELEEQSSELKAYLYAQPARRRKFRHMPQTLGFFNQYTGQLSSQF